MQALTILPSSTPNNILNLIVPSVSTGFYSSVSQDPSFNDLNYLPYHQHLGVDYRYLSGTTLSNWQPITPADIGYQGKTGKDYGEQHLWYQTKGLYIKDGTGGQGAEGDYSPNSNPGPGHLAPPHIYH